MDSQSYRDNSLTRRDDSVGNWVIMLDMILRKHGGLLMVLLHWRYRIVNTWEGLPATGTSIMRLDVVGLPSDHSCDP